MKRQKLGGSDTNESTTEELKANKNKLATLNYFDETKNELELNKGQTEGDEEATAENEAFQNNMTDNALDLVESEAKENEQQEAFGEHSVDFKLLDRNTREILSHIEKTKLK